jgi:hypothetical protein
MIRITTIIITTFCWAVTAQAVTLFPAGAESKIMGIESSLESEGPPAVLYNPANLAVVNDKNYAEPYAELGMLGVNYKYEHPEYDPVSISVVSPVATLGYTNRLNNRLTFSAIFFPREGGDEVEIPAVPRKIGDSYVSLNVKNKKEVGDAGIGVGLRIIDGVSIGFSGIRTYESYETTANMIDNDNSLVEMKYRNNFNRVVYGARVHWSDYLIGTFSMRPEVIKNYRGYQKDATGTVTDPTVANYEAKAINVGFGGRFMNFIYGAEAINESWSNGSHIVSDGLSADNPSADLVDTTSTSISAGYKLSKTASEVRFGFANVPSHWGDGIDDGNIDNHVAGINFGQTDGVDRKVFTAGGKMRFKSLDMTTVVSRSVGSRLVEDGGDNVGFYYIDVTTVAASVKATF